VEGFLVFIFIAGGFVALIVWGIQHAKKVREKWAAFAQQNGLTYSGGISATANPHIAGWYGRTHVTINTITRGSGKNRSTYTQFHAHVNVPMPQGLNLTREGLFNKVGKFFGGQDVQLGDRQLDDAFLIKAHDALGAMNLMRIAPVKAALLTFVGRHANMQLNERHVMFEENGVLSDMARMKVAIDDLAYLCQTLEAGYAQLGGTAAPAQPQRVARTKALSNPGLRPAAAAEILGAPAAIVTSALTQRQNAEARAAMDAMENDAQTARQRMEADVQRVQDEFQRQSGVVAGVEDRAAREAFHDQKMQAARALREAKMQADADDKSADAAMRRTGARAVPKDSRSREAAESNAVSKVADAFHKLEAKMADAGAFRADDVAVSSAFSSAGASSFAVTSDDDAFKAPPAGDAFKVAAADAFAEPSTPAFSKSYESPKFETPKYESPKFDAAPAQNTFGASNFGTFEVAPEQAAAKTEAVSFDDLVKRLSQGGMFSSDRDKILAQYKDRVFILQVEVTRIERTFGFDLPDNMRDGRTIEGQVKGKEIKVAARYPASENQRLDRMQSGVTVEVQGSLAGWDDLFKKATLNGF